MNPTSNEILNFLLKHITPGSISNPISQFIPMYKGSSKVIDKTNKLVLTLGSNMQEASSYLAKSVGVTHYSEVGWTYDNISVARNTLKEVLDKLGIEHEIDKDTAYFNPDQLPIYIAGIIYQ